MIAGWAPAGMNRVVARENAAYFTRVRFGVFAAVPVL